MTLKLVAAAATLLAGTSAVFANVEAVRGRDYEHMYWGVGHSMFGGLMMLVFWGIVVALIVLAVRWISQADQRGPQSSDAMEILKTRFAKGELNEEEFLKRKALLQE